VNTCVASLSNVSPVAEPPRLSFQLFGLFVETANDPTDPSPFGSPISYNVRGNPFFLTPNPPLLLTEWPKVG
jgi:hypothetical protein